MSTFIENTEHTKTQFDEKPNQALQQLRRTVKLILEELENSLQNLMNINSINHTVYYSQ